MTLNNSYKPELVNMQIKNVTSYYDEIGPSCYEQLPIASVTFHSLVIQLMLLFNMTYGERHNQASMQLRHI